MAKKKNKIFVLDTNVILHDYRAVYSFEENDIVIPITVLEELDKFKKGHDELNWAARQFTRALDKLAGDKLFTEGVSLGNERGKIYIQTHGEYPKLVKDSFQEQTPDHRILATAYIVQQKNTNSQVILVSKDINLRMKAKSIGIVSEDYENDKIRDLNTIEEGIPVVDNVDSALVSKLYSKQGDISLTPEEVGIAHPKSHDYFIIKSDKSSVISYYNPYEKLISRVVKRQVFGISPRNAEQTFALHALTNPAIKLIAITGKAGTGKTLVALAAALEQHELYEQILLARPIVALANKDMGFLPGAEKDKIRPYMLPLFDNLNVIKQNLHNNGEQVNLIDTLQKSGRLEISPLAYIRGRSLPKVYFIIDEAQNLTPHEVKTIITRAGEGTKIVFTGDIQQIDSPYLDAFSNGLSHLSTKMKGQKLFTHINLIKGERSELAELASILL